MHVDLKKLKPFGIILILGCTVLALIVCFTADMGVPERYVSIHNTEYYAQNSDTMAELINEMEENVFPNIEGIEDYYINEETNQLVLVINSEYYGKTKAVILRDFDESLFEFIEAGE